MGRLIDADALCNKIREIYDGYMLDECGSTPLDFENMVEDMPTAYDVDAVVKQLDRECIPIYDEDSETRVKVIGKNEAIDIIRNGWKVT